MTFRWLILVVLVAGVGGLVPCAMAQECEVYREGFDLFSGPRDFDDGTFRVQWCEDGAAVTASSFCPTGSAYRIDAQSEDPIVWVHFGGAGCTSVTISFDYSQFAATGTSLRFLESDDAVLNCGAFVNEVGGVPDTIGGVCTTVTHTVELKSGQSVYWKFDHGPGTGAFLLDNVVISFTGCCGGGETHGCCVTGGPGCEDARIEACVCAIDPFCCTEGWDDQCVSEVESLGCSTCGTNPECRTDYDVDFGSVSQPGTVCALFPSLFESCEGAGPFITSGTACGGPGDMAMSFAGGFPHSAARTPCIDLSGLPAARLDFSYTKQTGTVGPRVEIAVGDGAFEPLWSAPIVFAGGCVEESIDLASYIGAAVRFRFTSASTISSGAAFDDIALRSSPPAHGCCEIGGPGCSDDAVESCVCAIDPFCCENEWDDLCIISVEYYGCGDCGLCVDEFAQDFGNRFTPGTVCSLWPDAFIACASPGPYVDTAGPCASVDDPAMRLPSGGQSAVVTRCIDLSGLDEASLRFNYATGDGTPPRVEVSLNVGSEFLTLWQGGGGTDGACASVCVDLELLTGFPYLLFRFVGGDAPTWFDDIAFVRGAACASPDIDGDGLVGFSDLLLVLSNWGPCAPSCAEDIDGNGEVDFGDLLLVLSAWS